MFGVKFVGCNVVIRVDKDERVGAGGIDLGAFVFEYNMTSCMLLVVHITVALEEDVAR